MEPTAYGLLRLTPGAFADLTPREFLAMAEAAADRRNEDRAFAASLIHSLVQLWSRRPVTLDQLLGGGYTVWRLKREEKQRARAKAQEPPLS